MTSKEINLEVKKLRERYGMSPTCIYNIKTRVIEAGGNIEEIIEECEAWKERKEKRGLKKTEAVKQKVVPVSSTKAYKTSYVIETPDHIMSRDEFFVFMEAHIRKSVYMLRGKYYTLKLNNIENDDLINDILFKCIRPTKDGVYLYETYLKNPNRLITIRSFVNRICENHFKDFLKGPKYTTPVTSLDTPIPGSDNLTLGDSVGYEDKDNISINELMEKCSKIEVSRRKSDTKVLLSDVLKQIQSGIPLTTVCHNLKISSRVVQKKFLENGFEDILGVKVSQEHKDKILGNR